ncbi:MAG: type IV pilus biogenesis/stability protein PilW [Panacagrimonas sp.]
MTRILLGALLFPLIAACSSTPAQPNLSPIPDSRPAADLDEAAKINTDLGVAYARNGDFDVALDKLRRALDQNKNYAPAHQAIAFVYQQRRDVENAERHFKRALQLSPADPNTRNNFGVFLCGQNRYAEAEKLFLQAANTPRYAEPENAYTNAGVCARRIPDLNKAEAHFREALRLKPDAPEALRQLASLLYERRDYARARAFLQRYERVGPPTAATLWMGAKIEFALGDETAAAAYARRLKTDFPDSEESVSLSSRPAS